MFSHLPMISSPINRDDLIFVASNLQDETLIEEFSFSLSKYLQLKYAFLTNSGIAAFYLILEILKEKSERKQVILPAYTAGCLVTAVLKAGLIPVLCDVSLTDFNLDAESALKIISKDTLAVVCVHMFGIGMESIVSLKEKLPPEVFLIEDCAQAMGAKIKGVPVGNFSQVSFFSFGRGKNFTTYCGGCIAGNSAEFVREEKAFYEGLPLKPLFAERVKIALKILAFSLITKPYIYSIVTPAISLARDSKPPKDFEVDRITNLQAALGINLLKRIDKLCEKRYQNGVRLANALKEDEGLIVPIISPESYPVFNRFPVIFKDMVRRKMVEKRLYQVGIETSRMYGQPLHQMFSLGYRAEYFSHANFLANDLLTLPVHSSVKESDLDKMIEIIEL